MKPDGKRNCGINYLKLGVELLFRSLLKDYKNGLNSRQGGLIYCLGPKAYAEEWLKRRISSRRIRSELTSRFTNMMN